MIRKQVTTDVALVDGCAGPKLVPAESIESDLVPSLSVETFPVAEFSNGDTTVGMIADGRLIIVHQGDGMPALSMAVSVRGSAAEFREVILNDSRGMLFITAVQTTVSRTSEIDLVVLIRAMAEAGLSKVMSLVFTKGDVLHLGLPSDTEVVTRDVAIVTVADRLYGFWKSPFDYSVAELTPTGNEHDYRVGDVISSPVTWSVLPTFTSYDDVVSTVVVPTTTPEA